MDSRLEANCARWDELVGVHVRAPNAYDLEAFRAGDSTLKSIELDEVGDVRGKRLLHLQCHFGTDTISWAQHGARAVGVDFSPEAIALARRLSTERGVEAEFVCSSIDELPHNLEGQFDIVFTSYGVLCWLPDLVDWGRVIDHFLAPGGYFYIVEQHPLVAALVDRGGELVVGNSYFDIGPVEETRDGSYADASAMLEHQTSFEWQHSLSDVVDALANSGLRIEFLHEFPFCMFQALPSMVKSADGWWRIPGRDDVPLLFSLRASAD